MKQNKKHTNVASIETDYVRSLRKKEDWRKKQKRKLKRKLVLYMIVVFVVFGSLINMYVQQRQTMEKKEQEKIEKLAQLETVQEEQEKLRQQLVKLDDDEYIAKLARKYYFLSDENEIIFSVPEKNKKNDQNESGKE